MHMRQHPAASTGLRATSLRATALAVVAVVAAALIWRLRPAAPTVASSDTDVVLGCAWLAWALAGYLAVAIAAVALAHVFAAVGRVADVLSHLAPAGLRRIVETAVTLSVAGAALGASTVPAVATHSYAASADAHRPSAPGGALDWPGLTDPATPATPSSPTAHPTHEPRTAPTTSAAPSSLTSAAPRPHATRRHHRADVGLVSGGRSSTPAPPDHGDRPVVVLRGDSLWDIAARQLGPTASPTAITKAWHEWYAANRDVVGADPDLIYPGQRLSPPRPGTTSADQPGSTR
jgi:resuscitation-promoting factor RpfA